MQEYVTITTPGVVMVTTTTPGVVVEPMLTYTAIFR